MKLNAGRLKQAFKRAAQACRLATYLMRDGVRFWRHAALSPFDTSEAQLSARIMYNVHALEKGMAPRSGWKPGRGRDALANLNDALVGYRTHGYDLNGYPYVEGIAILARYVERHAGMPDAIAFLAEVVDPVFLAETQDSPGLAGTKIVRRLDRSSAVGRTFYEVSQGRSSIREFSGDPIDAEAVVRALQNAAKTPSVCNRQGWRVYWTNDKELVESVLHEQRGFRGPRLPEVLLTITVSSSTFVSPVERNQGFVDGGLFSMSVLYGLEAEGLAAVPLNACLYARARSNVIHLLEIDPAEEIVMFVAIGSPPSESRVPASDRRSVSDFLQHRGRGT